MIFPGMDPYLEDPAIWPEVHASSIIYIRDQLQPKLRPRYVARVGVRVFVEGPDHDIIPDVWLREHRSSRGGQAVALADADAPVIVYASELEIHEPYIDIIDLKSDKRVVTSLEMVSPTNKYAGPGRKEYVTKQREVRASQTHLIEIDLLRTGPHVLAVPERLARLQGNYDYLVSVNRALESRVKFELYLICLRQCLPRVRVPLSDGDPDVVLELQAVLEKTYEAGFYREEIDYAVACRPPLSRADQRWANQLIRRARKQP
jgi:hypothetical protein